MTSTLASELPVSDSYEAVFQREYPKVARLAFLLLGRTGEAEEAAQDAFLALFERWGSVDSPGAFVRTATVHRCRDIGRRRTVQTRILRLLRPRSGSSSEPDYLLDALQQLDVNLRELIVLRYYLQHTVPEIAHIVGVPEGTVKSRLHRALKRLGTLLDE